MLEHTGKLGDVAQRDLTPTSARARVAQGRRERGRFALQPLSKPSELFDLLRHLLVGTLAFLLNLERILFELRQRFGHRLEQRLNRLLALFELRRRVRLLRLEALLRELEKLLLRERQRVTCDGPEMLAHFRVVLFENGVAVAQHAQF